MSAIGITRSSTIQLKGDKYHGEAEANKKYRIIDNGPLYHVKRKLGPFYFYIRTNYFKRVQFDNFGDVVRYVIERKKEDERV